MLTPGIEYFGARDDEDAVAFFEGRQASDVPMVRFDGLAPGGDLALFGSLLTGRAMDDLAGPEQLRILATEDRDAYSLLLAAIPDVVVQALVAAQPDELADVARRARMFAEYVDVPEEVIVGVLSALAEVVRAGRSGLYARILVPRDWAPTRSRRGLIRQAAPWAGLALATVLLVTSLLTRPAGTSPLLVPVIGVLAAVSLGVLIARRVATRADRIAKVRGGFVLLWVADRPARAALGAAAETILGMPAEPPHGRVPGRWGQLSVDPSGVTAYVGREEPVRFPVSSIVSLSSATIRAGSGGFGLRAPTAGVAFRFTTAEGRQAEWVAPLVDAAGQRLHPATAEDVVAKVADLLGRQHL